MNRADIGAALWKGGDVAGEAAEKSRAAAERELRRGESINRQASAEAAAARERDRAQTDRINASLRSRLDHTPMAMAQREFLRRLVDVVEKLVERVDALESARRRGRKEAR